MTGSDARRVARGSELKVTGRSVITKGDIHGTSTPQRTAVIKAAVAARTTTHFRLRLFVEGRA
jgi:hypothetical protein